MSRRNAIITTVVVLAILVGALFFIYEMFLTGSKNTTLGSIGNTIQNYLPFGAPSQPLTNESTTSGKAIIEGEEGSSGANTNPNSNQNGNNNGENQNISLPKLREISSSPVSGATVYDQGTATATAKTIIRYVDRGTGHILEADTKSAVINQISNTTIPKIYEAVWGTGGSVVMRYASSETIKSFIGYPVLGTTTNAALSGSYLDDNIYSLAYSPLKDSIFYTESNGTDGITGIIWKVGSKGGTRVFSSPVSEWSVAWPNKNTLALITKPSYLVNGFLYFLNSSGGMTKIVGDIAGLTASVNPSADYLLFSESQSNTIVLHAMKVKDGTSKVLSTPTLPEKCIWSKKDTTIAYCAVPFGITQASYPDDWYKGKVNFADNIYKINVVTGASTKIFDATTEKAADFDGINLALNQKEDTLIFTNKTDSTLWSLDLSR